MTIYLRAEANGGYSECRSPDNKVGYGRCYHVLGNEKPAKINYNKDDRCKYVDINEISKNNTKEAEEEVKKFLEILAKNGISKEKAIEIMDKLK